MKRLGLRVLFWLSGVLFLGFIAIQFVPVERANPPVTAPLRAYPLVVEPVLRESCYDCHSHETVWPWYSYIAPISWLVAQDVREGRERLNFSEFAALSPEQQAHAREEIWEEVEEGAMPLPMYLVSHPQARLAKTDLAVIRAWRGVVATSEAKDEAGETGAGAEAEEAEDRR
jgi:hypothetical protein